MLILFLWKLTLLNISSVLYEWYVPIQFYLKLFYVLLLLTL